MLLQCFPIGNSQVCQNQISHLLRSLVVIRICACPIVHCFGYKNSLIDQRTCPTNDIGIRQFCNLWYLSHQKGSNHLCVFWRFCFSSTSYSGSKYPWRGSDRNTWCSEGINHFGKISFSSRVAIWLLASDLRHATSSHGRGSTVIGKKALGHGQNNSRLTQHWAGCS